jgi:phosphatidylinositol-3-phosphatase
MRLAAALVTLLAMVALAGPAAAAPSHARVGAKTPCVGGGGNISHVVVIVQENAGFNEVRHSSPYLTGLAHKCALFTDYRNLTHPSLPNYMAMTSGHALFDGRDCDPKAGCDTRFGSIFNQTGRFWRVYAEDEPGTCVLRDHGLYAVRHTAAPYYIRVRAACQRQDVPMGPLDSGRLHDAVVAGELPAFTMIIGNLNHDAHDTSAGAGDRWLAKLVPMILRGPQYRNGSTLVEVTWDEGSSSDLYTVVAAAGIDPGRKLAHKTNHYGLLATNEYLLGIKRLGLARGAWRFSTPLDLR